MGRRAGMTGLLLVALVAIGCSSSLDDYVCSIDEDCSNGQEKGACEPNGFCSFEDGECPSTRRYGSASGPQSNRCVVKDNLDAGPEPDASFESCADFSFTVRNIDNCQELDFGVPVTLDQDGAYLLDTDNGILTFPNGQESTPPATVVFQAGGPDLFVIRPVSLEVGPETTLVAVGSRPLVVLAKESIRIDGNLLATGRPIGPGAGGGLRAYCLQSRGSDGEVQAPSGSDGGSGGGGGGFGSAGGRGGAVANSGGPAAEGGIAASGNLVPLRGGCSGGAGGGNGGAAEIGGEGGSAGGAIQLVAGIELSISGVVSVSGEGGDGAVSNRSGGGGGGSGGALLLQSSNYSISGAITANGGGGGEGDDGTLSGVDGSDGALATEEPAAGGLGQSDGGDGGTGATRMTPAGAGLELSGSPGGTVGGGGGGGGAGKVDFDPPLPAF